MHPSSHGVRRACAVTLLVVSLGNAGCYAWHTEPLGPQAVLETLKPKQLRVTRSDSSQTVLEEPEIRADSLVGFTDDDTTETRIPLSNVREVATPRFSAGRTFVLLGGLAGAAYAALVAILLLNCDACH